MTKLRAKGVPLLVAALSLTIAAAIAASAATPTPTPTARTTATATPSPTPSSGATASSTASATPSPSGSATATPGGTATSSQTPRATPTSKAVTGAALYVTNPEYWSVLEFPAHSQGDAVPKIITGPSTGLEYPAGIYVDSFKDIFVANSFVQTIVEFGGGKTGNLTPVATISGSNTGLQSPYDVALDGAGNIYVTNQYVTNPFPSVTKYPPASDGNVAPIATISGAQTGLAGPRGIVIDGSGVIYVANSAAPSITEYAAGSTADAAPIVTIAGSNTGLSGPAGITLDGAGNVYVTNYSDDSVAEFAAGATGDVAPAAIISGPSTGLSSPASVAVDASNNIYVANYSSNTVTEYAAGSSGDAAPIVTLSGTATQLLDPQALAIASNFPTAPLTQTPTPTPTPRSIFAISPDNIVFPTVGVGATPVARTFTITNPGAKAAGDVDASELASTKAYKVKGKGPFTLGRGESKTVKILFVPPSGLSFSGTISVTSKSPKSLGIVSVTGTAESGVLQLSPQFINFGDVPVGSKETGAFIITNSGLGVLSGTVKVYKLLAGCTVTSGLGAFALKPTGTWKIDVQFAPTSTGASAGYLVIKSDDPAHPSTAVDFGGKGT